MNKYKCQKCGKEYETKDIRFSAGNKLSCVYCLGMKTRDIEAAVPEPKGKKPKEDTVEYVCSACNYSFKRKKKFVVASCPYCNKENTTTVKRTQDADKLVKDSMDRRYDF